MNDVLLRLRRGLVAPLAVTLAIGGVPGVHLDLDRPLQAVLDVHLDLGSEHGTVVPPVPLDYAAAGALRSLPARFRAIVGTYGYTTSGRLASGPATLRATAEYTVAPYEVRARLRGLPAKLRGVVVKRANFVTHTGGGAWAALLTRNGLGWTFKWRPTAPTLDVDLLVPWGLLDKQNNAWGIPWAAGTPRDAFAAVAWREHMPLKDATESLPWSYPPANDHAWSVVWRERMLHRDLSASMLWLMPPAKDRGWELDWQELARADLNRSVALPYLYPPKKDLERHVFPWGPGGPPDYSVKYPPPVVVEKPPVVNRSGYVCMDLRRPLNTNPLDVLLRLRRPLRTYCDTGSFIINNHLNVITLLDGLPLEVLAVSMSSDISSFAWNLRLTLPTYSEFLRVKPSPANDGVVEVQITLNGYVWRGFIDTVSRSREFANDTYTAEGKSFTAYGAQPFAPVASVISTSDSLTQQLANDAFQYLGFDITWDAVDWVVPAGLFAYTDKDPMSALAQICEAGGMFILPGRYDRSLIVRSRYPVTIWHWDDPTTDVDAHIPLNQMISGASRYQAGTDFTRVFVSGTEQGNTIDATRDGTAGDKLAPQVVNAMLATDEAASERARVELCKGGARIFNTYMTPIVSTTEPGVRLRSVGELVAVDEQELDDLAYNGLITSLSVAAVRTDSGQLTAYQRWRSNAMSNPWDVFSNLLPKQAVSVGVAETVYPDDTVALTVPNGIVRVARAGVNVSTGAQYYYRNGAIIGEAPFLPVIQITI